MTRPRFAVEEDEEGYSQEKITGVLSVGFIVNGLNSGVSAARPLRSYGCG